MLVLQHESREPHVNGLIRGDDVIYGWLHAVLDLLPGRLWMAYLAVGVVATVADVVSAQQATEREQGILSTVEEWAGEYQPNGS